MMMARKNRDFEKIKWLYCGYCEAKKPWFQRGELRTLGRLRELSSNFLQSGAPISAAKNFCNAIHPPLFKGDDALLILDLLPIPELHIMLGIVNRIFDDLNKKWGDDQGYDWASKNNIPRVSQQGGSMNGPAVKRLLEEKLDKLFFDVPSNLRQHV